jgi:hypothetical protein
MGFFLGNISLWCAILHLLTHTGPKPLIPIVNKPKSPWKRRCKGALVGTWTELLGIKRQSGRIWGCLAKGKPPVRVLRAWHWREGYWPQNMDPASVRETEFIAGMLRRRSRIARVAPRIRINEWVQSNLGGNGVHQLVSRLPWVFRGGTVEAPSGPECGWSAVPSSPLRGCPAVVSRP